MLSVNYSLNCVTFDPKGKILQVRICHPKLFSPLFDVDWIREGSSKAGLNLSWSQVWHSCRKCHLYLPGKAWCFPVNQESLVTQLPFFRSLSPLRRALMTSQVIRRKSSTLMTTWVLPSLAWQLTLDISASSWELSAWTTGTLMTLITPQRDW